MIIFSICAVAYLVGWLIMKSLVPKYENNHRRLKGGENPFIMEGATVYTAAPSIKTIFRGGQYYMLYNCFYIPAPAE